VADALPSALYHPRGDTFVPTALTIGPWSSELQHGGPPSGLLARALAAFGERAAEFDLLRVTVDLLRPIPLVAVRVQVQPLRQGREAEWLTARLLDTDDRLLAVAHGLRVRRVQLDLPEPHTPPRPPPPPPGSVPSAPFDFFPTDVAFHRAIDVRLVQGTWPHGPVTAWLTPTVPLVAGQPWHPVARVMTACDALNGVVPALTYGQGTSTTAGASFPNAELAVHLRRPPRGAWVALAGRSTAENTGSGLAQATLFDGDGELGVALETLVVRQAPG